MSQEAIKRTEIQRVTVATCSQKHVTTCRKHVTLIWFSNHNGHT